MINFPNAKINLGLHILERRPDGYHNIASCFYPTGLTDALEMHAASQSEFQLSGIPLPDTLPEQNLIMKAFRLLEADHALPPVSVHLLKGIPAGAGLGGGSADAAFAIRLLNDLFNLELPVARQQAYARKLGSDCAFFIRNKPCFCFGKGDEFEETTVSLAGKWLVLVNPGIHISTAEAYANVTPNIPETDLRTALSRPLSEWRDLVVNDFEASVFPAHPEIAALKQQLYDSGAIYASMTGSGSTVYGIFGEAVNLYTKFAGFFVWQGELT